MAKDGHSINSGKHVMPVRGEYLALIELHKLFRAADSVVDAERKIALMLARQRPDACTSQAIRTDQPGYGAQLTP